MDTRNNWNDTGFRVVPVAARGQGECDIEPH